MQINRSIPVYKIIVLIFMIFLIPVQNDTLIASVTAEDYKKEIINWQKDRLKRLKAKDGWLSLAGLYWLKEGDNTFGSGVANSFIVDDKKIPSFLGTFKLENKEVTFFANKDVSVLGENQPISSSLIMKDDSTGEPTTLTYNSYSWYIIKRGARLGVRLKDAHHPNIKRLTKIDSYPIDPLWRIKAKLQYYETPKEIETPTVLGTIVKQKSPGVLVFQVNSKTHKLYPIGADNDLFLIFGDVTNGSETYGGGRFLTVKKPGKNGYTHIDFNKAYNPPCVFSKFATCPMPPRENILNISVTAGEKVVNH